MVILDKIQEIKISGSNRTGRRAGKGYLEKSSKEQLIVKLTQGRQLVKCPRPVKIKQSVIEEDSFFNIVEPHKKKPVSTPDFKTKRKIEHLIKREY